MEGVPKAMKWQIRLLIPCTAALAIVGCEKPAVTAVPGFYVAEYDGDQDTLRVSPDGTYTHAVGSGASQQVDKGQWTVETLPGEQLGVSFNAFRFREHGGGVGVPGIWHVPVAVNGFSDEYKLCFDPDLDSCFVKKEPTGPGKKSGG